MSDEEFRREMALAFHEGRIRGKWEVAHNYYSAPATEPLAFPEWYEKVYSELTPPGVSSIL